MILRKKNKIFASFFLILFISGSSLVYTYSSDSTQGSNRKLKFLACGDINLGRKVGKKLLAGEVNYPFEKIRDSLKKYDLVFGNLESQLSDQDGETQNPRHNLIFTGPPEGAKSLKDNFVSIVSTANNHAFDYGKDAFEETIDNLQKENVLFAGTSKIKDSCFYPVLIEKNGFKIAFFAVTDFLNIPKKGYTDYIAFPDTSKLFPIIRSIRKNVDLIFISYHGGNEYVDKPLKKTIDFAHNCLDCGVDLFLGHHPHVVQGIELYKNKPIFYSLGNFVFHQPQKYWTQRTFLVELVFEKINEKTAITKYRILPAKAGLQPEFLEDGKEKDKLIDRIKKLSPTVTNLF